MTIMKTCRPSEEKIRGKRLLADHPEIAKFLDAKYDFEQPIMQMVSDMHNLAEKYCESESEKRMVIHCACSILNILVPAWVHHYRKSNPL